MLIVLALAVGGCGRRGRLEPPPDPNNPFALGTDQPPKQNENKAGIQRRRKVPRITPPNDSFVLDPIL